MDAARRGRRLRLRAEPRRRGGVRHGVEGVPFPLLADADREMIRAYGVYVRINFESWNMARPAVVLIDPAGIAREVWVGRHQREWPVTEDLWAVIDRHDGSGEQ